MVPQSAGIPYDDSSLFFSRDLRYYVVQESFSAGCISCGFCVCVLLCVVCCVLCVDDVPDAADHHSVAIRQMIVSMEITV